MTSPLRLSVLIAITLTAATAAAQTFDEKFEHWPLDLKINGTIIAAGSLDDPTLASPAFLQASGNRNANLVGLFWTSPNAQQLAAWEKSLEAAKSVEIETLDLSAKTVPDSIHKTLEGATGVLLVTGETLQLSVREQLLSLRKSLQDVIKRGGAIYTLGAAARLLSKVEITGGDHVAKVGPGWELVPDGVIETRFTTPQDRLRLESALVSHPRSVGIGLAPNAAMVLAGRKLQVLGTGQATVMVAANEHEPLLVQHVTAQTGQRQDPNEFLVDWTQWRRVAMDRTLPPFPVADPEKPFVEQGALVIVGGGGMPKGLMKRFVELAGGVEKARLVYVPCSEQEKLADKQGTVEAWRGMGVKHATFIHTKDRNQANSDEEFLAPLKDATGIWFGGGRQWNMSDSYYGTKAHQLMKDVVRRGGVVGGSSAGASIQARYLARATPIQNFMIMAPGYERGGLGFISGVAIDQHFSQRGRQKDMTQLVNRYPQLLGIGLDEATAIIVRKSTAEVVGAGKAHFYDRNLPVIPDRPDFVALPKGSVYDLAERTIVKDTSPEAAKVKSKTPAAGAKPQQ